MPVRMRIGELARDKGLTIKALAARAGVAYNTAHALYTGRALRIDLDTLDRISGALEAEPGELFVRNGAPRVTRREPEHEQEEDYGSDRDRAASAGDLAAAGSL